MSNQKQEKKKKNYDILMKSAKDCTCNFFSFQNSEEHICWITLKHFELLLCYFKQTENIVGICE